MSTKLAIALTAVALVCGAAAVPNTDGDGAEWRGVYHGMAGRPCEPHQAFDVTVDGVAVARLVRDSEVEVHEWVWPPVGEHRVVRYVAPLLLMRAKIEAGKRVVACADDLEPRVCVESTPKDECIQYGELEGAHSATWMPRPAGYGPRA